MSKTDFIKLYRLEGIQERVQEKLEELKEDHSKLDSLETALSVKANFGRA